MWLMQSVLVETTVNLYLFFIFRMMQMEPRRITNVFSGIPICISCNHDRHLLYTCASAYLMKLQPSKVTKLQSSFSRYFFFPLIASSLIEFPIGNESRSIRLLPTSTLGITHAACEGCLDGSRARKICPNAHEKKFPFQ